MKPPTLVCFLTFVLSLNFSFPSAASSSRGHHHHHHHDFLKCLTQKFHNYSSITTIVYTPSNSSFTSLLRSSIKNLRFATDATPKPQAIITPDHESQIPPVICCARKSGVEIRTRSGGHDFEGLSSVSQLPFVIIDLINLSEISVDVGEKTAWVGAGATIGSLYYRIAERSPVLWFPAGIIPTVGVGGHFSGGGYGTLMRKYGLSADNIIDARIVDVNDRILDRKSMRGSVLGNQRRRRRQLRRDRRVEGSIGRRYGNRHCIPSDQSAGPGHYWNPSSAAVYSSKDRHRFVHSSIVEHNSSL